MNVNQQLEVLGKRVEDRVTGLSGVATSVCFDLYGCVQVCINPGLDKDGKSREQAWYDAARLLVKSDERVMEPPDFNATVTDKGPAEKPAFNRA